jgi:hypothetical protein
MDLLFSIAPYNQYIFVLYIKSSLKKYKLLPISIEKQS